MPHRVLIIDDHPLMRDAIRTLLDDLAEPHGVDTASTLGEAMRKLSDEPTFDLMLLDLRLPDASGFEGLKTLRSRFPSCPTVVLSGDLDCNTILHCLELGAAGFIPKTLSSDGLRNALRVVADGDIYVPQQVIVQRTTAAGQSSRDATDPRSLGLTDRQIDVLKLILRGLPNKLICRRLNLAEGTIKVHVSAVLRSLGVRSRTQAIVAANSLGLRLSNDHDEPHDLQPMRLRTRE
jgi:DNA-binding NarL/FixJ family response regulator